MRVTPSKQRARERKGERKDRVLELDHVERQAQALPEVAHHGRERRSSYYFTEASRVAAFERKTSVLQLSDCSRGFLWIHIDYEACSNTYVRDRRQWML